MPRTILGIDIETEDKDLKELGPGIFRYNGDKILGVSFCDDTGYNEYLSIGHFDTPEEERRKNLARIRELCSDPCPKLGANILYDANWITHFLGIDIKGSWIDVQTAQALIWEYEESYSLDSLAEKYLGLHKEKDEISDFCEREGLKGDPRKWLWKMPSNLVAKYARADTSLLLPIWEKQKKILEEQDLLKVMDIECRLLPFLVNMYGQGVKIDEAKRKEVCAMHQRDLETRQASWKQKYGTVNYNSTTQLASLFDRYDIPYALSNGGKQTLLDKLGRHVDPKRLAMLDEVPLYDALGMTEAERGKFLSDHPSITKEVLENLAEEYPIAQEVEELKRLDKIIGTFVGEEGSLSRYCVDGRIHANFYPTSSDEGGCRTGRFSSANPNLQQIPAKKGKLDPMVRHCFVPNEGCAWMKCDLSSAEYRMLAHYCLGPGSEEFKARYNADPDTDFHDIVKGMLGIDDRGLAKKINFSVLYYLSEKSMVKKYHWTPEFAQSMMERYFKMVPFVNPTREAVLDAARRRGYVKTILGRRCRMSPQMLKDRKYFVMFNSLLQGSVGMYVKKAMVDIYEAGLADALSISLVVHDELDASVPYTKEGIEAARELAHLMETAVQLKIPMRADPDMGHCWGTAGEFTLEDMEKELQ